MSPPVESSLFVGQCAMAAAAAASPHEERSIFGRTLISPGKDSDSFVEGARSAAGVVLLSSCLRLAASELVHGLV